MTADAGPGDAPIEIPPADRPIGDNPQPDFVTTDTPPPADAGDLWGSTPEGGWVYYSCPGVYCTDVETTCDNGVDEDCDGLADCYDPDCRMPINVVANHSFEAMDACGEPANWMFTRFEGVPDAFWWLDPTRMTDGALGAKVYAGPLTPASRVLGFVQLWQATGGIRFDQLADQADGLSFWF